MLAPHRASASKLSLLAHCARWARVDVPQDPRRSGPAANNGTAAHAALGCLVRGEEPDVLACCDAAGVLPADVAAVLGMADRLREWWPAFAARHPLAWRSEAAYALREGSLGTECHALGLDIGRDYEGHGKRDGDLCMSLDLEAVSEAGVLVVDLKTGRVPHSPEAHAQLEANALAACLHHGATRARCGIATLSPRGVHVAWGPELGSADLARIDDRIAAQLASIPGAEAKPGPWCRAHYCPAQGSCPATGAALAVVEPEPLVPAARLALGPVRDDASARAWIAAIPAIEAACDRQREAVREWLTSADGTYRELDLGNGRVYHHVTSPRESIEARPDVLATLAAELGDYALLASKMTVSKPGIERAVAAAHPSRGRAGKVRAILYMLDRMGAVKQTTFGQWKEEDV